MTLSLTYVQSRGGLFSEVDAFRPLPHHSPPGAATGPWQGRGGQELLGCPLPCQPLGSGEPAYGNVEIVQAASLRISHSVPGSL